LPVKNSEDWKGPICTSVDAGLLNVIGAAVIYFLGTVLMPVGNIDPQTSTIAVRADGYRGR
jgi:hypothetical protein